MDLVTLLDSVNKIWDCLSLLHLRKNAMTRMYDLLYGVLSVLPWIVG